MKSLLTRCRTKSFVRRWFALALACALGLNLPAAAEESYPTKPIRLVVTISAGSTADLLARTIAAPLSKQLGQPVVIENQPGAGGNIAGEYVARQRADGYTLLLATISSHGINPNLYKKMPYDALKGFSHIIAVASVPNTLIVSPALQVKSVDDFVRLAKAKPGELNFSSGGIGTSHHLAAELFNALAGTKMEHIPYRGTPEAVTSVSSGEVAMMFPNAPNAIELARSGKVKALAITSRNRVAWWPELPTMIELGFHDFEVSGWYGLVAPAGTPDAVVRKLNAEVQKVLEMPSIKGALAQAGFETMGGTAAEFRDFNRAEIEKWGKAVARSNAAIN